MDLAALAIWLCFLLAMAAGAGYLFFRCLHDWKVMDRGEITSLGGRCVGFWVYKECTHCHKMKLEKVTR